MRTDPHEASDTGKGQMNSVFSSGVKHGDQQVSRRTLLGGAAGALFSIASPHILADTDQQSPSDTLNIAGIGLGYRGYMNIKKCATENIVALCDVDWNLAAPAAERFPDAETYTDYRRMFDERDDLDAVVISTPDHSHAVITAEAMKRGLHVYTEMPLAHNVWEVRRLTEIAREKGVVTQMGNQRHSAPVARRACEWVWSGKLGPVRKVQCWTNRPNWPQGLEAPNATMSPPSSLDWDLWLGPVPEKQYSPAYHPGNWKGWRDFGTGALGAIGTYVMDAPYWALKLEKASRFTVEADSTGLTGSSYPRASTVRYEFPARGEMPPVELVWRDGGRLPPSPDGWPQNRETPGGNGFFIVGDECTLTNDQTTGSSGTRLVPESRMAKVNAPGKQLPRLPEGDRYFPTRHQQDWVRACKKGEQPCSSFNYSGPLTEMVLLGNVALAAGGRIEWDRKKMKITNDAEANQFLRRKYRQGWSL